MKKKRYYDNTGCEQAICFWRTGLTVHGHRDWGEKYPLAGGYVIDLPLPTSSNATAITKSLLTTLQQNDWIDITNGTRVVFVNINLYNPSLDLVLSLRLTTEFFSSGGASTSVDATIIAIMNGKNKLFLPIFLNLILICLFLWRTLIEINDLAWGQAHGFALMIENDDYGQYIMEKTGRRPTQMVSETALKIQLYRSIKYFLKKMIRKRRRWCSCSCRRCSKNKKNKNKGITKAKTRNGSNGSIFTNDLGKEIFMEDIDPLVRPVHLGCVAKCFSEWMGKLIASLIAWTCCGCCCGFAGAYKITAMLMRSRKNSRSQGSKKKSFCFCCPQGYRINDICCWSCKKVSNLCKKVDVEDISGKSNLQKPSIFALLFSSSSDQEYLSIPTLTLKMWMTAFRNSKYFNSYWNYYELILVITFWIWIASIGRYNEIKQTAGESIASAISMSTVTPETTPFVDLDHVSWHATWAHDLLGALFIGMSIHSLKILSQVPFGVGTKVTAITSIFVHPEILPFYVVLTILLVAFAFGFYFAYGDSVGEYRSISPSFKNMFLMTLMGADLPNNDEMTSSNSDFYFLFTILIILIMVLVLMNVFIAVVSEVYAKAANEAVSKSSNFFFL